MDLSRSFKTKFSDWAVVDYRFWQVLGRRSDRGLAFVGVYLSPCGPIFNFQFFQFSTADPAVVVLTIAREDLSLAAVWLVSRSCLAVLSALHIHPFCLSLPTLVSSQHRTQWKGIAARQSQPSFLALQTPHCSCLSGRANFRTTGKLVPTELSASLSLQIQSFDYYLHFKHILAISQTISSE